MRLTISRGVPPPVTRQIIGDDTVLLTSYFLLFTFERLFGGPVSRGEDASELRQSRQCRQAADARHRAAHEHVRQQGFENRQPLEKEILVPERGLPRRNDQDETRLEKVGGEQEAGNNRDDQPPVCTRASRSARSDTSRYSPALACSSRNTARARAV